MQKEDRADLGTSDITINSRKEISISGVKDVKSFNELEVVVDTQRGLLLVKGSSLFVKTLSLEKGMVKVEGCIDAVIYNKTITTKPKKSTFKRLFT